MVRSRARVEGHDAFVKMMTDYTPPVNPYSANLRKSHNDWNNGFWDATYDWKQSLTPQDCMNIARALREREERTECTPPSDSSPTSL